MLTFIIVAGVIYLVANSGNKEVHHYYGPEEDAEYDEY